MSNRSLRRLAWLALALSLIFYAGTTALLARLPRARIAPLTALYPFDPTDLGLMAFAVVGLIILLRHPRHAVGWLFLAIGFTRFAFSVTSAYLITARLVDPRLPVNLWVVWLPTRFWVLTFFASPLLLMIFPSGRLLSPRWRWIIVPLALTNILMLISAGSLIEAASYSFNLPPLLDMLGLSGFTDTAQNVAFMLLLLTLITSLICVILRFRRSRGEERLQIKWFSFAGIAFLLIHLVMDFGFFNQLNALDPSAKVPADLFLGIPTALSFALIALAAGFAILRYHLYDIDILIRKTLIYGLLTASLALIYAGSVILLQSIVRALTGEGESPVVVVLSTLAIASLFTPLRLRIQNAIDKRFYRRRYDAEKVLAAFSATARDEVDLPRLSAQFLSTVDQSLHPDRLSLWMRGKNPPK